MISEDSHFGKREPSAMRGDMARGASCTAANINPAGRLRRPHFSPHPSRPGRVFGVNVRHAIRPQSGIFAVIEGSKQEQNSVRHRLSGPTH